MTGGAGFIGSNFVRFVLSKPEIKVIVVDKLTYAGNKQSLEDLSSNPNYSFFEADIANRDGMQKIIDQTQPTALINFAAETHVDRSIDGPTPFIQTNMVGTFQLLDLTHHYLKKSNSVKKEKFRFLHVSTDEVYGSLGKEGLFSEETPYAPNSPYSASKAGADHLVRAYYETYKLPALITNCSNNYGPYQFPEKMVPLMITNAIEGKPLPVYGDGKNVRDWLYVEDHCIGIWEVLKKGTCGQKYNIGGHNEWANVDVVKKICEIMESLLPVAQNEKLKEKNIKKYSDLISFVKDRPGHDRRYAIDASKVKKELGWAPQYDFSKGLEKTINWYLNNRTWWQAIQSGQYRGERLGLKV